MQTKVSLGERIKQILTYRMFLDKGTGSVDINLLLGLLTFLAWGHDHLLHGTAARISHFAQLAMTLVFDLRLNRPPPDDSNMLPVGGSCSIRRGPTRSLEERRAVLACFVMSSMFVSSGLYLYQRARGVRQNLPLRMQKAETLETKVTRLPWRVEFSSRVCF